MSYEEIVRKHYAEEAARTKDTPQSTMQDHYVRQQEVASITVALNAIVDAGTQSSIKALEIGCGNGYLLSRLVPLFPQITFSAIEFSPELLSIAQKRGLAGVSVSTGDCRQLSFPDESLDVVIGERVLINLLDKDDQKKALKEIARVLRRGGFYLMVEGFLEPHEALNQAREELGMGPIPLPFHNLYFGKSVLAEIEQLGFERQNFGVAPNFLSTHYFIARVLHESVRCENSKIHNTRFVDFFDKALPSDIGDYAAIKFYSFRKDK